MERGLSRPDIELAHPHSIQHRKEVLDSSMCGCFYCRAQFATQEIERWIDGGETALCPHCGVDAIIGDASGFPVTVEFLTEMYDRWF
jgi:hypothetical protein